MKSPEQTESSCCCHGEHDAAEQPAIAIAEGLSFKVEGLDCVEEVSILKNEIGPLVGGEDNLFFDVINGRMTIKENGQKVDEKAIIKAIAATGMQASRWNPKITRPDISHRQRSQVLYTFFSGFFIFTGIVIHIVLAGAYNDALAWLSAPDLTTFSWHKLWQYLVHLLNAHTAQTMPLAEKISYGIAILLGIRHVLPKAFYALKRLRADMNLLMVVAIIGAIVINEWFEAAAVSFLFSLSLAIESWSVGRARHAVEALLDLTPETVTITDEQGHEQTLAAEKVQPGALYIVRPGDKIALDGIVESGVSSVNQAPITGESMPVTKKAGDTVYAGSINIDSVLHIKTTKAASDTTLARIIRLVEEAHSKQAHVEQWVEKFARIYTPIVMVLALAVFLIPPLLMEGDWQAWLYRALVLLVIACPCALVISTPVSIVAALACSARQGVLVKGGVYIELPAHLKVIAFDKTGTLTQGKPEVTGIYPFNGHSEQELLSRAAALESRSNHPLAHAIVDYAKQQAIEIAKADNITVIPGKGVTGHFKQTDFWLGSRRYLLERSQETETITQLAEKLEQQGQTVIAVGNDNHVCGLIALADALRPESKQVIQQLQQSGIQHLVMLTGDNRITAENLARQLGLNEFYAELLPEDKLKLIDKLARQYGPVAMVGDGINDAPALTRASLGIAMGTMGSDTAIETADIALMSDDLSKLPWLIRHSKRTLRIIRQNIVFALSLKAAFAILAFAGIATLWQAIAADMGASLIVVANGLRLLHSKQ